MAALPPEKTRYPFYRRLGGPQGWSVTKKQPNLTVQKWQNSMHSLIVSDIKIRINVLQKKNNLKCITFFYYYRSNFKMPLRGRGAWNNMEIFLGLHTHTHIQTFAAKWIL